MIPCCGACGSGSSKVDTTSFCCSDTYVSVRGWVTALGRQSFHAPEVRAVALPSRLPDGDESLFGGGPYPSVRSNHCAVARKLLSNRHLGYNSDVCQQQRRKSPCPLFLHIRKGSGATGDVKFVPSAPRPRSRTYRRSTVCKPTACRSCATSTSPSR